MGDEPRTQKFKTDTLPALYHSLKGTHCATVSTVYIRSNEDDKVVLKDPPSPERPLYDTGCEVYRATQKW